MLTIAGSGISLYSLEKVKELLESLNYDCFVADQNFNTPENQEFIPDNKETYFLPLAKIFSCICEKLQQKQNILYVVTGSPQFFSSTTSLLEHIKKHLPDYDRDQITILPSESSMDYMLRKLKVPANEVMPISFHGRDMASLDLTRMMLLPYTFVLCDETTLHKLALLLQYVSEFIEVYLGSKLGSQNEKIEKIDIQNFCKINNIDEIHNNLMPFVLLIKRNYVPPNSFTENNDIITSAGMLTKIDKRALTLQALSLMPNHILWDIGAGSGSISIDAYKLFKCRTFLFEKKPERCQNIKQNLKNNKIIAATVFENNVLNNINNAERPDRIFIGGGGEEVLSSINYFFDLLKPEGLILANIVSLENLSTAITIAKKNNYSYEVRSIIITNYKKMETADILSIGNSQRTLYQFTIYKNNNH